ncbi:nuclear transport factor 2 family protein [Streptomyces sp. NPDC101206]|uniref:nuclear transport factor 2 family protein n=1 Tax=Streptomyces sp. NPDC101206 TaxID=3366128 RepID=UPI003825723C
MGENTETLQRFLALIESGAIEEALRLMDPEVVIHEAESLPYSGDFHGPEGFIRLAETVFGLATLSLSEVRLLEDGDTVISRSKAKFTAPTGRVLETEVVELYTFHNGRIIDIDAFYKDTHAVVELLRSGPGPSRPPTAGPPEATAARPSS